MHPRGHLSIVIAVVMCCKLERLQLDELSDQSQVHARHDGMIYFAAPGEGICPMSRTTSGAPKRSWGMLQLWFNQSHKMAGPCHRRDVTSSQAQLGSLVYAGLIKNHCSPSRKCAEALRVANAVPELSDLQLTTIEP